MRFKKFLQEVRSCSKLSKLGGKEHEKQILEILKNLGFTEQPLEGTIFESKGKTNYIPEILNNRSMVGLKDNSVYYQPFGTQQNPDFIVTCNNVPYFLECKSSKTKAVPTYNSKLPSPDCIYIFSSNIKGKTVTYLGSEVAPITLHSQIEKLKGKIKNIESEFNKNLNQGMSPQGIGFYCRPMYNHYNSISNRDYFDPDVIKCRNKNINDFL